MSIAIRCERLSKMYFEGTKDAVLALKAATFSIGEGEVFGMIGADGAGKTTTFKMLSGVMDPSAGKVEILGRGPRQSQSQIGYLTQPFSLYQDLSVDENIRYAAAMREVPVEKAHERASRYLETFGMSAFRGRLAGRLSGGMKQKLALACCLVSAPKILLLDEPTTGVDPVSRREFWDALATLASHGMTIVVATPYLDEAERCTRVACLDDGEILDIDTPARLRSKLGLTRLSIHAAQLNQARKLLTAQDVASGVVHDVQRFGDRLDVMVRRPDEDEPLVLEHLDAAGIAVDLCQRARPTLENAFVSMLRERRLERDPEPLPGRGSARPAASGDEMALSVTELNKKFGDFRAVKDLSFEIRRGEIYGLLGANGAGKTTAIKMICGLLAATSGRISLLGRSRRLRAADLRARIGYKSQKFSLYDDLTLEQNLEFYASVYGIPAELKEPRKRWALAAGLEGQGKMLTGKLPGGWQQRVAFSASLMHEPELVLLDEPTSGVDPLARRAMWQMIDDIASHGAAVLVVTHYLEEAEQCNRLGFMVDGAMVAQGSPTQIKRSMHGGVVEVETADPVRSMHLLREPFGEANVSLFGDRLHVFAADVQAAQARIRSTLTDGGVAISAIDISDLGLEDVFLRLSYKGR
ncbi:MAG: ATP-binding cassette domain-containing protein, partial [Bryobacterales bacterium]